MDEAKEYKEWCMTKGYKQNDITALKEYNELKRISMFRSKMNLYGDNTLDSLADNLKIARQTLSRKISGEADFTQTEMSMIKLRYNLTDEEFAQLFIKEINQDECTRSSETVK